MYCCGVSLVVPTNVLEGAVVVLSFAIDVVWSGPTHVSVAAPSGSKKTYFNALNRLWIEKRHRTFALQNANSALCRFRSNSATLTIAIITAGGNSKESTGAMDKGFNAKCATRGTDSSSFDAGNASWMYVWNVVCIAFSMLIVCARDYTDMNNVLCLHTV